MRHSTPALTANLYTDPHLLDVAGALDRLPDMQPKKDVRRRAVAGEKCLLSDAPNDAPTRGKRGQFWTVADAMNIHNESNRTKIRAQRIANKDRGVRALSYPDTGKSNGGRCRTRTCDPLGVNQVL
jgi:hypothetical protein